MNHFCTLRNHVDGKANFERFKRAIVATYHNHFRVGTFTPIAKVAKNKT